jgi:hypothetical protein
VIFAPLQLLNAPLQLLNSRKRNPVRVCLEPPGPYTSSSRSCKRHRTFRSVRCNRSGLWEALFRRAQLRDRQSAIDGLARIALQRCGLPAVPLRGRSRWRLPSRGAGGCWLHMSAQPAEGRRGNDPRYFSVETCGRRSSCSYSTSKTSETMHVSAHHAHLPLLSTAQATIREDIQKCILALSSALRSGDHLIQFAHRRAKVHGTLSWGLVAISQRRLPACSA